jgi:hypothetical protein
MTVPLQTDNNGVIRVRGTQVTLDMVVTRFRDGTTPEAVPTHDLYTVIAYYLAHHEALDAYVQQRATEGERLRRAWEAKYPPKVTHAELECRAGI